MSARRKSLPLYLCMSSWFLKRQGICDSHDTYQYFCLIRKKLFSSTSALSIVIILPISLIIFFLFEGVSNDAIKDLLSEQTFSSLTFIHFHNFQFFFKNNAGDRLQVVLMCVLSSKKFFSTIFIFACLTLKKMKEFTSIKNHYLLNTVEL